jgi:hypothetical protein
MQICILIFRMEILRNMIFFVFLRHLAVCNKDKLKFFILITQSITNHHLNSPKSIRTINNLSQKLTIY